MASYCGGQDRDAALMERGELLPDDVVTETVVRRLEQPDATRGAILDGFPRTLDQAVRLDRWLAQRGGVIRGAVYLDVPRAELIARLLARGKIGQRNDDRPGVADRRVDVFLEGYRRCSTTTPHAESCAELTAHKPWTRSSVRSSTRCGESSRPISRRNP